MTDVLVIGAGHNGLVTATYLAKAGLKVTVLEAAPQVGGAAVTREFAPGYKVSGVAHLLHGLHPTIARDLDLGRHGVDLKAQRITTRSLLPDGRNLEVGPDMAASAASITGISKTDADAYPAAMARLGRMADALASYALNTPPRVDAAKMDWREKLNLGKFAWSLRRLGKKDMLELTRILTMNVNDLANDYFESPAVKGLLCFEGSLGLFLGPRSPSTVFNLLYRLSSLGVNGQGGFLLPKGGMGSVTQALAKAAQAAGVTIRTGAAVDHILIENDAAAGVVLSTGEELRAGRVASNADPQRTALQLIGPQNLDTMFVSRIRHMRMNGCAAKIHLALDGLPDALANAQGRVVVAQKPDDIERGYDCAKYGRVSDHPVLEIVIPTLTDPSLAPAGKHVASIVAQYCPYKLKGVTQHEARQQIGARSLKVLEEVAPGISQRVTATEILTPYDLEAQFGMTGGQWHHGEITLDQVLFLRPAGQAQDYRMPVPGVYLCGAGAHPGGNVSGAPGYNAAREILKDVRAQKRVVGGSMTAYVEHLKPFLRKTPFHDRIEALMHGNNWMRWTGHYSPASFESVQSEYMAIRNGASVYDVSPLIKYKIHGRQAAEYVNHLITRDLSKIKPMQAFYTSWCQDDGMLVEEGTIFRFSENDFLLNAAKDQLHWLEQAAYGFDVKVEEASNDLAGVSLQGPQSRDVLRAFGINGIDHLKRFGIIELELNGHWLRIDRAGFTGDLGYEIWSKPQDALWLWDRLFDVGRDHKIAPIGAQALEISRIEAGFILIDADYSGALHALRPSNRMSPYELGIGWTVNLNKPGYFVGKRALKREKEQNLSRYVLTGIEIEGRKPAPGAFLYADQAAKHELGLTTSAIWSPTLKKNIAYARVPMAYSKPGTEMWIEIWYNKEHKIERSMVRCWAANRMFYDPPRKSA